MKTFLFLFLFGVVYCTNANIKKEPQEPHFINGKHNLEKHIISESQQIKNENEKNSLEFILDFAEESWQGLQKKEISRAWKKSYPLAEIVPGIAFLFNFANVVVFETTEGLVMIDSGSMLTSEIIYDEIRQWKPDVPLNTVILTHGHYDHVFGIKLFDQESEKKGWNKPQVIGHKSVLDRFSRYKYTNGYNSIINSIQFQSNPNSEILFPTDFRIPDLIYADFLEIEIGNEIFEIFHARGETDDASWIFVPSKKILCTGDLIIWSSPNSGNPQKVQRYSLEWSQALRKMAEKEAEILFPGHGTPILGKKRVKEILENTALYLEIIEKQTVEKMNKGLSLNDIIKSIEIPSFLLEKPYLQATYDEPEFVVRNIWRLYGGWWDKNPANLKPPTNFDFSSEIISLIGNIDKIVSRAEEISLRDNRLAISLIQIAMDAFPLDSKIAKSYIKILNRASETESSLMAKGIYGASAKSKSFLLKGNQDEDHSFLESVLSLNFLGIGKVFELFGLKKKKISLDINQLNYEWFDKALNTNSLPKEYELQIQSGLQEFKNLIFQSNLEWELISDSKEVMVYSSIKNDIPIFKITTVIDSKSPRDIMALILDDKFDSGDLERTIERLDSKTALVYGKIPGRFMIKSRDLLMINHLFFDQNPKDKYKNSIYLLMKSVENDQYPISDEFVRVNMLGGGFYLSHINNDRDTSISLYYWVDTGLPSTIAKQVGIMQSRILQNIYDAFSEK